MSTKLRRLQDQIDALRNQLGFSAPGEVIYLAPRDVGDEFVVVEADGFGGATIKVVEGNYPLDFFTSHEKAFLEQATATQAAESILENNVDPAEILD